MLHLLVHSPLVGPSTWQPVAEELERRGVRALLPTIPDGRRERHTPYWKSHALAVADALSHAPAEPLVIVAHSGAGLLLPAIREAIPHTVAAYAFVDAGIPEDGKSRLDLLHREMPEVAAGMLDALSSGARLPAWTDDDLREVIPDPWRRRAVVAELRPQPMAYHTEPIPVFEGWPDAPACYLQFSPAYNVYAMRAVRQGWAYRKLDGGHFHMLANPAAVTDTLLDLVSQATSTTPQSRNP